MTDLEALIAQARTKGPERAYLNWLRTQPSALDGTFGYWDMDAGQGLNEPCHCRTSRFAGTGTKPAYLAIPLTSAQHRQSHQHGDSTIGDREWWKEQCVKHLKRWVETG